MQPFDKHPADAGALHQTASELRDLAGEALELAAATRAAYAPAIGNWHGMGAAEMAAAGEPVQRDAEATNRALTWAAVVTEYWVSQVEGFNAQVDAITAGLAGRAAGDYGATGTDGAPPTAAQVADARGAATAAARQQWMQAYDTHIDTGRHRAASMLARGPTEQNLAELRSAGVLPPRQGSGAPAEEDDSGWLSSLGHGVLDAAGLVPVFGEAFDGINALWYLGEGDKLNASLSAAGMIPIGGWFATGAKGVIKGGKAVAKGGDDAADAAKRVGPKEVPPAKKPTTTDDKLGNIIDNLYKGSDNPSRVGDGTTADAVRHERSTGDPVHGRTHSQKARESIRALENWLRKNPDASDADRATAQREVTDLRNALGEE